MYGARDYLAYLRYGAKRLFQDETGPWQLLVPERKIYWSRIAINIARSLTPSLPTQRYPGDSFVHRNSQNVAISCGWFFG